MMKTPFSAEQFFKVFEQYNQTVFPGQLVIALLGLLAVIFLHLNYPVRNRYVGIFLGVLWLWTGIVYHITFFSKINQAAFFFGDLFIIQGLLILYNSYKNRLHFTFKFNFKGYIGYFFILYGLIIYPLIQLFSEASLIKTISLGLPCPSVIFTFGFFILTKRYFSRYLLIIPTLWALVGISAVINFGVFQDLLILVSAICAIAFVGFRKKAALKI